jgi:hypothetical protein
MPTMATDTYLLPTKHFADAKSHFSDVMTEVVHRHHPLLIDRHRGKEHAVLFGAEEMRAMLAAFRFDTQTIHEAGEWTLISPELNLTAGGASFDEALDELTELAAEYAATYFERFEFYRQTDRRSQLPWVTRLAVTPEDQRRDLFVEPPREITGSALRWEGSTVS